MIKNSIHNFNRKRNYKDISEDDNPIINKFKNIFDFDDDIVEKHNNHIYFYAPVNQDTCLNLNRQINDMNRELLKQSIDTGHSTPCIYLHINSMGGCLFSAFSTIDTILSSKIPIVSIIEGCAASAATIIAMVCKKRFITPNSYMLIHQLSSGSWGKYEELKDEFMNDTKLMEMLYKLYREHTTMKEKTIKKVLKRDLWWDADTCIKNGLIDKKWMGHNVSIIVEDVLAEESVLKKRKKSKKNQDDE
jgi:ATP-dependent protease ClpP protease subunit